MKIYWGMAQWHVSHWQDWLYSSKVPTSSRLGEYGKIFNTVEVGSTFYSAISTSQLHSWYQQVDDQFRFVFKLPHQITHQLTQRPLSDICADLQLFCDVLRPLQLKLGVSMMQFPATIGPETFELICRLIQHWSLPTPLSVEVRHLAWFDKSVHEKNLMQYLQHHCINRVIMDSRPVFSTEAYCESLIDAQRKKPKVPCHPIATSKHPVVRFIGHPEQGQNQIYLQQWAKKLAQWLSMGLTPYVFVHSSDNHCAPILAQQLESLLCDVCPDYHPVIQLPEKNTQLGLW